MKIYVVSAVGKGRSELGAFDSALHQMGVYNYNLIRLSSIIPPATEIILPGQYKSPENEYGYKMFCIYAEIRSSQPGQALGAAVGWYQRKDGRGVFVEHETLGTSEGEVKKYLLNESKNSLRDCIQNRGWEIEEDKLHVHVETALVQAESVCTFIVAAFKSEGWI